MSTVLALTKADAVLAWAPHQPNANRREHHRCRALDDDNGLILEMRASAFRCPREPERSYCCRL
jgi:hypothetical protein